jgi:hypothetical protein
MSPQRKRGPTIYSIRLDFVIGIATGYGLDDRRIGVRVPRWGQEFSLLHVVQTGSVVHPTSYSMGTGGKATGA